MCYLILFPLITKTTTTHLQYLTALNIFKNTIPGPDGIHYKFTRYLLQQASTKLLDIFKHIWNQSPNQEKITQIPPIIDPYSIPVAFVKPLNACSINVQFVFWNLQCGFCKHRNPVDHLICLTAT